MVSVSRKQSRATAHPRRGLRHAVLALLPMLLAGCTILDPYRLGSPQGTAAPVVQGQPQVPAAAVPEERVAQGVYVVRSGDTLSAIGRRAGLNYLEIARWNGLSPPYTIFPGDRLRLSPPVAERPQPRQPPPVAERPQPRQPPPVAERPRPRQPLVEEPLVQRPAASTPQPAAPSAGQTERREVAVSPSPATGRHDWIWPAEGELLRSFARSRDGKQGINIGGQLSAPVWAARDGNVVYSGDGLVGYGNLVIVSHDSRTITAYGYNSALLVQEGDAVRQGDPIALMGTHGGAPVLHFELRVDGQSVDPIGYLPPRP